MRLTARLVPGFRYAADVHKFPIEIEVSTEAPTEIHDRIDVTGAFWTKPGEDDATFGYAKSVFYRIPKLVRFASEAPRRAQIDLFKDLDDLEGYCSGRFVLEIKVPIAEKDGESIRHLTLWDSLEVVVA